MDAIFPFFQGTFPVARRAEPACADASAL
jgi:hypothetical protein